MRLSALLLHALIGRNPRRTGIRILITAALLTVVCTQVLLPTRILGESMEPTVHDGSWRAINLLRYHWSEPRRGDVVCIRLAGRRVTYVKRVLAGPGDRIAFNQGHLIVNGEPVAEPYVHLHGGDWQLGETTMGENRWFVAGDNRSMPARQHVAGVVERSRIIGSLL